MKIFIFSVIVFATMSAFAWEGYDYQEGDSIEIEEGNLVREGEEVEFYDYNSGEYRTGDVESIDRLGSSVEVEVYDHELGEYRTFEMED
jgi:hypothetical protein